GGYGGLVLGIGGLLSPGRDGVSTKRGQLQPDGHAVGDRSLGYARGEERPYGHSQALSASRDLERDLLPGQERRHLASAPARLPALAHGLAAVPPLAGQRHPG